MKGPTTLHQLWVSGAPPSVPWKPLRITPWTEDREPLPKSDIATDHISSTGRVEKWCTPHPVHQCMNQQPCGVPAKSSEKVGMVLQKCLTLLSIREWEMRTGRVPFAGRSWGRIRLTAASFELLAEMWLVSSVLRVHLLTYQIYTKLRKVKGLPESKAAGIAGRREMTLHLPKSGYFK